VILLWEGSGMSLPTPPADWLLLVDTSAAQGRLDCSVFVKAGVSGIWHKATEGLHDVDTQWKASAASSLANKLPFGAYGVLEPYGSTKAQAQANHFCDTIENTGWTLAPWLDFELAHGVSGLDALTAAAIWCDAVEQRLGRGVCVYTGPSFIQTLEKYAGHTADAVLAKLGARPLVVAHYNGGPPKSPMVPPPWKDWTIWQASGDHAAKIPGTTKDIDVDFFRGTIDDLLGIGVSLV